MFKQLIAITFLLLSYSFAQIDTLNNSSDHFRVLPDIDTSSIQGEYYQKGYEAAKENFSLYDPSDEIPAKYVYELDTLQWESFKKGYNDGINHYKSRSKEITKSLTKCGMIGCGIYGIGVLIMALPWMLYEKY